MKNQKIRADFAIVQEHEVVTQIGKCTVFIPITEYNEASIKWLDEKLYKSSHQHTNPPMSTEAQAKDQYSN